MDRRAFLKTTVSALTVYGLAMPAISQRAAARALRFVPQADLANFDPIWNTRYVGRSVPAATAAST
jgi:peptide/nickel transport system substrate-binding protein